jgi:hypothetical protein
MLFKTVVLGIASYCTFAVPELAHADVKIEYSTNFVIPKDNNKADLSQGKIIFFCKGNKIRLESGEHITVSDLETGFTYFFDKDSKEYTKSAVPKVQSGTKAPKFPMSLDVKGTLRPGSGSVKVGKRLTQRFSGTFNLQLHMAEAKDAPSLPLQLALNFKSCRQFAIGSKLQETGFLGILQHLTAGMPPPMGTMLDSVLWQNPTIQTELGRATGIPLTLRLELTPGKGMPQLLPADKPMIYELQVGPISEAALPDALFTVPEGRTLL